MKLIGTGLGDDIHHSSSILAVFRAVVAGLHAELLKRVRHREGLINVRILVDVIAAV